jgi:hypothetical protein
VFTPHSSILSAGRPSEKDSEKEANVRTFKLSIGLFFMLAIASRASAQKVTVDFDPHASFSDYETFMWIEPVHYPQDPLMERRIMNAINTALTDKGLHEVPLGADIGVVAHTATRERHTLETFYTGFGGGWRWGMGWGQAITTPETYTVGTLVVDLFDARTMQLIWRGVGTETLSDKPEKDTQKLNKTVEKMFKDFPPKSK